MVPVTSSTKAELVGVLQIFFKQLEQGHISGGFLEACDIEARGWWGSTKNRQSMTSFRPWVSCIVRGI